MRHIWANSALRKTDATIALRPSDQAVSPLEPRFRPAIRHSVRVHAESMHEAAVLADESFANCYPGTSAWRPQATPCLGLDAAYSRRVIGRELDGALEVSLALAALCRAMSRRMLTPQLVLNSDRGGPVCRR